jgi:hypothetical protein
MSFDGEGDVEGDGDFVPTQQTATSNEFSWALGSKDM